MLNDIIVDEDFLTPEEITELHNCMVMGTTFENRYVFDSDTQIGNEDNSISVIRGEEFSGSPQVCMQGQQDGVVFNAPFDAYAKSLLAKFAIKHLVPVKNILRTKTTVTFPKLDSLPDYAHVDYETPGRVLIIYVNDSDGDTILYNEKYTGEKVSELTERIRVSPKAGKAVMFDNFIYHAASNPASTPFRQIINMNFTTL